VLSDAVDLRRRLFSEQPPRQRESLSPQVLVGRFAEHIAECILKPAPRDPGMLGDLVDRDRLLDVLVQVRERLAEPRIGNRERRRGLAFNDLQGPLADRCGRRS
jgi:hypothetical protein